MPEKSELFPDRIEVRGAPKNLQPKDWVYFQKEKKRLIPKTNLVNAKNVFVNDEGLAFSLCGTFSQGPCQNKKSNKFNTHRYRLSYLLKRKKIPIKAKSGKYILAFDSKYSGYFHWFADTIPRLMSIQEECKGTILILPCHIHQFHLDSLEVFKFQGFHFLPHLTYSKVPLLLFPELIAPTGNYNGAVMNKIRNEYLSFYNLEAKHPFRIVYISRMKSGKRKIENERELTGLFQKHNVEINFIEDYSFKEQVKLMSETKILISIHGAGLTNMLFMGKGTKILEIRKENDGHNLCYFSLANALKISYYYLWGRPQDVNEDAHTANLDVDPAKLEKLLISMLYDS